MRKLASQFRVPPHHEPHMATCSSCFTVCQKPEAKQRQGAVVVSIEFALGTIGTIACPNNLDLFAVQLSYVTFFRQRLSPYQIYTSLDNGEYFGETDFFQR